MNSESDLRRLLTLIEKQLDWGPASDWQSRDFDRLNILILEKTKVSLSASTLRRVWGRVAYEHQPSAQTLDALAQFIDYPNWRTFTRPAPATEVPRAPLSTSATGVSRPHPWIKLRPGLVVAVPILVLALLVYTIFYSASATDSSTYSFSSRLITRDLPNSVIFTYDAHTATDTVFIQQSWDARRRAVVRKDLHQYTSMYYLPGFYEAKLVVGKNIVQEHPLVIPTSDWLGTIAQQPVPVYLKPAEFNHDSILQISPETIANNHVPLGPVAPTVEFYNVGNFAPTSLANFDFTAEVKNLYREGAARCQRINITLITNNVPISIPLSAPGCISELSLLDARGRISGKSTDLSGFGCDLSQWTRITCRSTPHTLQFLTNDKVVFESPQPDIPIQIVGVAFSLQGAGCVRNVILRNQGIDVFRAFPIR